MDTKTAAQTITSPEIYRDDLLGKNCTRSADGNAPEGPFHGKPPYRKRTEDLDDSL